MAARAAVSGFTRRRLFHTLSGLQFFHLCSLGGGGSRSTYQHSLYGGLRSSRFISSSRDVELDDLNLGHRIDGAPPPSLEKYNLYTKYLKTKTQGLEVGDPSIRSTLLHLNDLSTSISVEALNANAHLLFLARVDTKDLTYFTAHSVEEEEDATLKPLYYIYPPSPIDRHCFFTGATHNGLFHFHNGKKRRHHYLWNPTTNEVKALPKTISSRKSRYLHQLVRDYVMCSCHGDTKLMLLVDAVNDSSRYDVDYCRYLELYSLKTNRWRYILMDKEYIICSLHGACIHGVYYAPATRREGGPPEFILSFDFASETFSTLPLPPNVSPSDRYHFLEYKGLLSLAVYSHLERVPSSYCTWVWQNGVWIQLSYFHTCYVLKPILYSRNGQMLYWNSLEGELMVLDCRDGHLKRLGIYCVSMQMKLCTLVENHVRLNVEEVEVEVEVDKDGDGDDDEMDKEEDYSELPWLQSIIDRMKASDFEFQSMFMPPP